MTTGDFEAQPAPFDAPRAATEPGGLLTRFLARLVDGIIVGIVGFALVFAIGVQSNILVTCVCFAAFGVAEGWTRGKNLFGLSVHGPRGAAKPDLAQSAIRNAFTLLP